LPPSTQWQWFEYSLKCRTPKAVKGPEKVVCVDNEGKYIRRNPKSAIRSRAQARFPGNHAAIIKVPQWQKLMVSEKALREFKRLWLEEFGEEITDEKALDEATALLTMFDAIYRPIKKEWSDEYDTNHKTNGTN
jgi:hypothetical protein